MSGFTEKAELIRQHLSDLKDHWCEDNSVDFLVGSVIFVKQSALNLIEDEINQAGYPERGDDIMISYLD